MPAAIAPEDRLLEADHPEAIHVATPTTTLVTHADEQESLDLRVDLVEDLHGDLLLLERRPGDLHQLALEQIAGRQQEEDEEDDQHRLPGERDDARRSPR